MNDIDQTERLRRNNRYYDLFARNVEARSVQREARSVQREACSAKREACSALDEFSRRLRPGDVVLDIGCGTGEHLVEFDKRGFVPIGIDPSAHMREIASAKGFTVLDGAFEYLDQLKLPHIDGIWCAASLLHVPIDEIPSALAAIRRHLDPKAPLFITVRIGNGGKWDKFDDANADAERFIQLFDERELVREVEDAGFVVAEAWIEESTWGRPSRWISIIAEAS